MKNEAEYMDTLNEQRAYLRKLEEDSEQAERTLTGEQRSYYSGRLSVIREMIETMDGLTSEFTHAFMQE